MDPDWLYLVLIIGSGFAGGLVEVFRGNKNDVQPLGERLARLEGQVEGYAHRIEALEKSQREDHEDEDEDEPKKILTLDDAKR